jgi:hypothetical protein
MKPKDKEEFSWTGMFISIGISFILFSLFIKLIDGTSSHSSVFFKIAMVSLVCWVIAYIYEILTKPEEPTGRTAHMHKRELTRH